MWERVVEVVAVAVVEVVVRGVAAEAVIARKKK